MPSLNAVNSPKFGAKFEALKWSHWRNFEILVLEFWENTPGKD